MRNLARMAALVGAGALAVAPPGIKIEIRNEEQEREKAPIPISLYRPASPLNRSKHWAYARTYEEARAISPIPHVPVR